MKILGPSYSCLGLSDFWLTLTHFSSPKCHLNGDGVAATFRLTNESASQVREKMLDLVMETFGRDVMYCLPYPTARAPDILCCLRSTVPHDKSFKQARMGIKGRRKGSLSRDFLTSD